MCKLISTVIACGFSKPCDAGTPWLPTGRSSVQRSTPGKPLNYPKKVCFVFNLSPTMTYLLVICRCIKAIGCNLESRPFTWWCLESLNSHVSNMLPGKSDFAAIICRGPDAAPHLTASFWRRQHISPVSGGNHPVWHEWINVVLPYLWTTSAETSNV